MFKLQVPRFHLTKKARALAAMLLEDDHITGVFNMCELQALIKLMESASPTCSVSIEPIRGTCRIILWWQDGIKSFHFECPNTRANVANPNFVRALEEAKEAMRFAPLPHTIKEILR